MAIDNNTKRNIAAALWLDEYNEKNIEATLLGKINSDKNSSAQIGSRMRHYIDWLKNHPQNHNPNYQKRYTLLHNLIGDINPQAAYVVAMKFLGQNATQGFEPMPKTSNIEFPRDHAPQLRSQVGWHFFVGSAWDEQGEEYGIELMFFRISLLPPNMANELGISDIENQVVEIQLGISKAGERHYQAEPIVVAGTSGLVDIVPNPLRYTVGKNEIRVGKKDSFFPITVKAQGNDNGQKQAVKLGVELTFTSGREYLYQGDDGCMPCVAGMGTLYYSIPNLVLKPGSTITYKGKKITLKKGTFWFDHQWGFLGGNSHSAVLRAANNIGKPMQMGWDWYMAQFVGNRQLTMFASHSPANKNFYFQTGPKPPGTMTVDVAGKYMDANKKLHNTWGTLTIDKWVKSEASPNVVLYPITHTWHPNHWKFTFDKTLPKDIRNFELHQITPVAQTNYFANGSQYNEGAVYITDPYGKDIGRGFAEAVQYADCTKNMIKLAGFEYSKELHGLFSQGASLPRKLYSFFYVLTHQKQLKQTLAEAKDMEFFSRPSKTKTSPKVGSRH